MAEMTSGVDEDVNTNIWVQDGKWSGMFRVKWIFLKDIPNKQFRHILIEANENKPVTNSRDTQEIPCYQGKQMVDIFKNYRNSTSVIDDFDYQIKRETDMKAKREQKKQE